MWWMVGRIRKIIIILYYYSNLFTLLESIINMEINFKENNLRNTILFLIIIVGIICISIFITYTLLNTENIEKKSDFDYIEGIDENGIYDTELLISENSKELTTNSYSIEIDAYTDKTDIESENKRNFSYDGQDYAYSIDHLSDDRKIEQFRNFDSDRVYSKSDIYSEGFNIETGLSSNNKFTGESYLEHRLDNVELSLTEITENKAIYEITDMNDNIMSVENDEDVTIEGELEITREGYISELDIKLYTNEELVSEQYYNVYNFGNTTVEEPEWIEEAIEVEL